MKKKKEKGKRKKESNSIGLAYIADKCQRVNQSCYMQTLSLKYFKHQLLQSTYFNLLSLSKLKYKMRPYFRKVGQCPLRLNKAY